MSPSEQTHPKRTRYRVYVDGHDPIEVAASNWITALGKSVEVTQAPNGANDLCQLACEVLPNGTVIVRDARGGHHFVIHDLDGHHASGEGRDPASFDEPLDFAMPEDGDGSAAAVAAAGLLSPEAVRLWAAMVFAVAVVVGALGSLAAFAGS